MDSIIQTVELDIANTGQACAQGVPYAHVRVMGPMLQVPAYAYGHACMACAHMHML